MDPRDRTAISRAVELHQWVGLRAVFPRFAGRRNAASDGLIVEVLPATQLIDLQSNVLLGLDGQPDRARRNTANAFVPHIREPGQFLVELLVVLVVGEVRRLDTEEVGKGG